MSDPISYLVCEMCNKIMTQEDHDFCDLCDDCRPEEF